MPRYLSLGNERMLVSFDADYRLRDLYYPHIGSENHVGGAVARTGVHVDGQFRWLERAAGWSIAMGYEPDTLVGLSHELGNAFCMLIRTVCCEKQIVTEPVP